MGNVVNPVRSGYTFVRWQCAKDGTRLADLLAANAVVTGSRTFLAIWSPDVIGDSDGGGDDGRWEPAPTPTPQPPAPDTEASRREAFLIGSDGRLRPHDDITRAEIATIFFRLIPKEARYEHWRQTNPFADVAREQWFNNAVSTATNAGIFVGLPEGHFAPHQTMTRGELAAVIVRFMEAQTAETGSTGNQFNDIAGHWASAYINAAAANGWVEGPHGLGGAFYPNQPVSRAEAAAMISRLFGRFAETPEQLRPDTQSWADNANEAAWYFLYMQWASHSYTYARSECGTYKTQISITPPRDWSVLERPDSRPSSNPG